MTANEEYISVKVDGEDFEDLPLDYRKGVEKLKEAAESGDYGNFTIMVRGDQVIGHTTEGRFVNEVVYRPDNYFMEAKVYEERGQNPIIHQVETQEGAGQVPAQLGGQTEHLLEKGEQKIQELRGS